MLKQHQQHQINYDYCLKELLLNLLPYGYLDLKRCITILEETNIYYGDFADYVEDFSKDCDIPMTKLDLCGLAYDYILQLVRTEIEEKTSIDILNDLNHEIYVYGNYCCSSYDYKDNEPTIAVINKIKEEDRSKTLDWFLEEIGG